MPGNHQTQRGLSPMHFYVLRMYDYSSTTPLHYCISRKEDTCELGKWERFSDLTHPRTKGYKNPTTPEHKHSFSLGATRSFPSDLPQWIPLDNKCKLTVTVPTMDTIWITQEKVPFGYNLDYSRNSAQWISTLDYFSSRVHGLLCAFGYFFRSEILD